MKDRKSPIELYSGIRVDSPETLEEVLRLLDSLDDVKRPALLPGVSRFRVREVQTKQKTEQPNGRRFVG